MKESKSFGVLNLAKELKKSFSIDSNLPGNTRKDTNAGSVNSLSLRKIKIKFDPNTVSSRKNTIVNDTNMIPLKSNSVMLDSKSISARSSSGAVDSNSIFSRKSSVDVDSNSISPRNSSVALRSSISPRKTIIAKDVIQIHLFQMLNEIKEKTVSEKIELLKENKMLSNLWNKYVEKNDKNKIFNMWNELHLILEKWSEKNCSAVIKFYTKY